MNKQAQENMISVIRKFLSSAPPSCDVEISVKYNLSKDTISQPKASIIRMNTGATTEQARAVTPRRTSSLSMIPRKLRSEERVALKDAIPILTPEKKTESSTTYEALPNAIKTDKEEVNVSAEPLRKKEKESERNTGKNGKSTDVETDEVSTSELFPVKKALRYNKNSGKYDDISY
ncbi:hypothetical protein GCK32_001980 [Trichostrongylus colubriformis]|uniref:Uncharacterized protein n=1 Tax=Trichostrongylus colubriformis TaxID=6319 RepID=A0AAN8F9T7_TRICO